jgi:hypothetical protein
MKLHKLYGMLMAAVGTAIWSLPALAFRELEDNAQDDAADLVHGLPGPGILSLVVIGIVAAVGIARRRS